MPLEVVVKGISGERDLTHKDFTKRDPGKLAVAEAYRRLVRNWANIGTYFTFGKGFMTKGHDPKAKKIDVYKPDPTSNLRYSLEDFCKASVIYLAAPKSKYGAGDTYAEYEMIFNGWHGYAWFTCVAHNSITQIINDPY